jgi:AcrR family transcriptional regulator
LHKIERIVFVARESVQKERKLQILKALDRCLQEKSFEKSSIKDIAREAGVNHGVLHYYFSSKEDILLKYIDHVIEDYQAQLQEWLGTKDIRQYSKKDFIQEIFNFVNHRITLNKGLSSIFVEIWEIALYNEDVRKKLRQAYSIWIKELSNILSPYIEDKNFTINISTAMVAFWEGMALFSTIFDPNDLKIKDVLEGFQRRILEIL